MGCKASQCGFGRCSDLLRKDRVKRRRMLAGGIGGNRSKAARRLPELQIVDPKMLANLDIEIGKRLRSGCRPD